MRRGEVWTAATGSGYGGKPRPVVILQDDRFDATASITVCLFTADSEGMPLFRIPVMPSDLNGLREVSWAMADKLMSVPRTKMGRHIGQLDGNDLGRLERAVMLFLGLAEPS